MLRAASSAVRNAYSLEISGSGAPRRTATATGERTKSTRLPASRWPPAINRPIASPASTTRSKRSPACTRRAASTPPTDATTTAVPVRLSKAAASLANTWRVAIDERQVIGAVIGAGGNAFME